jgi:TRAP-type C4-dicarboxylate transport system permease large subunit
MDAFILLGSFFVLMMVGMPVAFALGLAAMIGALWIDLPLDAVMIQLGAGVNKFSLLAIHFFVLAGAIMAEGGMARRLVAFAGVLIGFVRGGLSLVNIMASTFFGAISGSSVADTASVGSVLIPEMEKKGYPRPFAAAVTVSGSVQAILLPPSHNAVIYSLAAGGTVSIAALFMAGVLPGLLMGLTLSVICLIIAKRENYPKGEVIPLRQALKICVEAVWGLMTMVIILGGILSGVFTPNESASIAVLWAFVVTMFVWSVMLGIPSALRSHMHIRIDTLILRIGQRARRVVGIMACSSALVIFVAAIYAGWSHAAGVWGSQTPMLGYSVGWIFVSMPIGFALTLFHGAMILADEGPEAVFRNGTESVIDAAQV